MKFSSNLFTMKTFNFIVIFLFIFSSCSQKSKPQEESYIDTTPVVKNGEVKIDYTLCGDGDIALLFVHGWGINKSYWDNQIDHFCNKYKVVAIDLPGFGLSGKNRDEWTIENFGKDVNTVIDQLGLEKVILIGHSMGGNVILEAALNGPEKIIGFVGIDNFKGVTYEQAEEMEAFFADFIKSMRENYRQVAGQFARQYLFHPDTDSLVVQRVVNDIVDSDSIPAIASIQSLLNYQEAKQLEKLPAKLHLINCDFSPIIEDGLKQTGIDYGIVNIKDSGHYPMIEKPEEFNQAMEETISNILATRVTN